MQDGTGRVVNLARDFVGDTPFVLSYGDILVDPTNYKRVADLPANVETIITVTRGEDVSKGGAVFLNEQMELIDIREKSRPDQTTSPWYNAGIYAFRPSIFEFSGKLNLSPRGIRIDRRNPRHRAFRQKSESARADRWMGGRARPGSVGATKSRVARASGLRLFGSQARRFRKHYFSATGFSASSTSFSKRGSPRSGSQKGCSRSSP